MFVLEGRSKKETKWKEKRQKTIKKKANHIAKTNIWLEMTEGISDLKTKCSASQSTLDSNICNKAMGIERKTFTWPKTCVSYHLNINSSIDIILHIILYNMEINVIKRFWNWKGTKLFYFFFVLHNVSISCFKS